jgi:hypothetical protein
VPRGDWCPPGAAVNPPDALHLRASRWWAKLATTVVELDPDLALRQAAIARVVELREAYDDLVPRAALADGFQFRGRRVAFSSFQKGIHRAKEMQGPAALSVLTAAPKRGPLPGRQRGSSR